MQPRSVKALEWSGAATPTDTKCLLGTRSHGASFLFEPDELDSLLRRTCDLGAANAQALKIISAGAMHRRAPGRLLHVTIMVWDICSF
jgi:hypothetical protein